MSTNIVQMRAQKIDSIKRKKPQKNRTHSSSATEKLKSKVFQ